MKKSIYVLVAGMFLLTGCMSHDFDEVTPAEKETTQEEINQNVKKVFGVNFSADQDWCTTTNSKVTISIKNSELSDVEKVQILTVSPFGGSDANGAKSLTSLRFPTVRALPFITMLPRCTPDSMLLVFPRVESISLKAST